MERPRFRITDPEPEASKQEATATPPTDGPTWVIVKVRTDGYVPCGFDVRSRIDGTMFTATASPDAIEAAEADPEVVSIAPARRLYPT